MDDIDWARLVRPQVDGYDTNIIRQVAATRYKVQASPAVEGQPTVFGSVPLISFVMGSLQTAPFTHAMIVKGDRLLKEWWPEQWRQCSELLHSVWPISAGRESESDGGSGSISSSNAAWNSVGSSVHGALGFCEGVIHEQGHWKLRGLGLGLEHWDNIVANDPAEMFESPVRKDKPRPMGACVHAQYSFLHVLEVEIRAHKAGYVVGMMALNRKRMAEGRVTLEAWRPVPGTEAFKDTMQAWADELVAEANVLLK